MRKSGYYFVIWSEGCDWDIALFDSNCSPEHAWTMIGSDEIYSESEIHFIGNEVEMPN